MDSDAKQNNNWGCGSCTMHGVFIKRIDKTLPIPHYHTDGSVAFDLYARIDKIIYPRSFELVPLNVVIKVPLEYALILKTRSSLYKRGLLLSGGVIDQDYYGPNDEVKALLYNINETEPVEIKKGERIVQGLFIKIGKVFTWKEVDDSDLKEKDRNGFGSTGTFVQNKGDNNE